MPKVDDFAISLPQKWFSPHKLPYWRQEPDYWVQNSYKDQTSKERFNSCTDSSLKIADVCSGKGSCVPFGDSGISFCQCHPGYGGAECQSKRLSQLTAWLLCIFLGPFGADQYYLGWYLEMIVTQIFSVLGVILLVAIPNSKLPGLVVLLGPWIRHVVIIGSAPAQATTDRTSADLPRCAFVSFSILWMAFIALGICMQDLKYRTQVKRINQEQVRNYSAAKIIA
ncbi:Hypothetical protein SCF082_LOCUS53476 [Durusdinium trenchii]